MPVLDEDTTLTLRHTITRPSSIPSIATSALLTWPAYSQPSRMPPTFSSSSVTCRSPPSTNRCALQPEISIEFLSKTLDPASQPWEQPLIQHVPLSNDPAIRKLSECDKANDSSSKDDESCPVIGPTGSALTKHRGARPKLPSNMAQNTASSAVPPPTTMPSRVASQSTIRRMPVPRTASATSNESLQSGGSFGVKRLPAAALGGQLRGMRHGMYQNESMYRVGHRSYASMSSWYTDTIHE